MISPIWQFTRKLSDELSNIWARTYWENSKTALGYSPAPSLLGKNKIFELALKTNAKRDIKVFLFCLTLLAFFIFLKIFCTGFYFYVTIDFVKVRCGFDASSEIRRNGRNYVPVRLYFLWKYNNTKLSTWNIFSNHLSSNGLESLFLYIKIRT